MPATFWPFRETKVLTALGSPFLPLRSVRLLHDISRLPLLQDFSLWPTHLQPELPGHRVSTQLPSNPAGGLCALRGWAHLTLLGATKLGLLFPRERGQCLAVSRNTSQSSPGSQWAQEETWEMCDLELGQAFIVKVVLVTILEKAAKDLSVSWGREPSVSKR